MAYYAYKTVRDLLPNHIIDSMGPDYVGDGNYDGDQWYAAEAYILELQAEIAKLKKPKTYSVHNRAEDGTMMRYHVIQSFIDADSVVLVV